MNFTAYVQRQKNLIRDRHIAETFLISGGDVISLDGVEQKHNAPTRLDGSEQKHNTHTHLDDSGQKNNARTHLDGTEQKNNARTTEDILREIDSLPGLNTQERHPTHLTRSAVC